MLLDADLFRRLSPVGRPRSRGLEDYATALRLVTGPPFSQMREEGGAGCSTGDRVDQHPTVAIVDVAHLPATSALAAGDTASARAAVDISRLAAPDEEVRRLDPAAYRADGRAAQARRTSSSRSATAPTTGKRRWTSAPDPPDPGPPPRLALPCQLNRGR